MKKASTEHSDREGRYLPSEARSTSRGLLNFFKRIKFLFTLHERRGAWCGEIHQPRGLDEAEKQFFWV